MKTSTHYLMAGLLMTTLFTSCSRPTATFQRTPREQFATTTTTPVAVQETSSALTPASAEAPVAVAAPATATPTPSEQVAQANAAVDQLEASISKNSALAADKKVQKRLNRVRTMLAASSAKASLSPSETTAPRKANLMERMMVKKINKKISKQLAPQNPEKTMLSTGTLATGAVLVLIGLLLLLLTTGTAATVGLVVLIVGAVLLLVGLF